MFEMKKRSRNSITAQILESATDGAYKSRIMYDTFLSYARLKYYLRMLDENRLIEYNAAAKTYKTTAKGQRFLKVYDQIATDVLPVDQQITELPYI
jgi:predicted transcriptional regulator